MEKDTIQLIVKTVNGKRMVYTEDGKEIKQLIFTRETQNTEFAQAGISELLIKVLAKCE
jgi:hypothetical protein